MIAGVIHHEDLQLCECDKRRGYSTGQWIAAENVHRLTRTLTRKPKRGSSELDRLQMLVLCVSLY